MNLFQFSIEEILTFFAVLVRMSVLFSVIPFIGDRMVPAPLKILLSLCVTMALYPGLVRQGYVNPAEAAVWGATAGGILLTVGAEILCALVLGYTAKLLFDAIHMGANYIGSTMGFSMASTYDPHQESHSVVVAEIQMAVAMLAFLALDGHHLLLRACMDSYAILGLGKASISAVVERRMIELTAQTLVFALTLAAPVAVVMFAVNVAFGVFSKTMPNLNILILSMSVTALVGLVVLGLTAPEFQTVASNILGRTDDWMNGMLMAMAGR